MKTGIICVTTISVLLYLILGTVSSSFSIQEQNPTLLYGSGSYPRRYESVKDLASSKEVDVVVHGIILTRQSYLKTSLDGYGQLISTKYSFKVTRVLKGDITKDMINVHQTGGTLGDKTLIMTEDPPMNVGDELILFLHHFTSKETYPDDYYVEGGPQGRFIVDGSNVYGLADLYRTPDVLRMAGHLKTNGLSLSTFFDQITQSK